MPIRLLAPARTLACWTALGFALQASAARAETPGNAAAAQGLFDEAKQLMAHGKAADACPKLEESQRLDPGSGTLINLAKCYEDTNRIASAWNTYLEAASAAAVAGNTARERGARQRAQSLVSHVPKLVIDVPEEARVPGLSILRDGVDVGKPQWGVAVPVDSGTHAIEVAAPGYDSWHGAASVVGDGSAAHILVPKLLLHPAAAPAAAPAAEPDRITPVNQANAAPVSPPPDSATGPGYGPQRIVALAVGGVAIVALATGGVFGLKAMADKRRADKSCDGTTCSDDSGANAGNDAHAAGNVSTVAVLAGSVCAVTAAALWFSAPKNHPSTQLGLGLGTLQLRGLW